MRNIEVALELSSMASSKEGFVVLGNEEHRDSTQALSSMAMSKEGLPKDESTYKHDQPSKNEEYEK